MFCLLEREVSDSLDMRLHLSHYLALLPSVTIFYNETVKLLPSFLYSFLQVGR